MPVGFDAFNVTITAGQTVSGKFHSRGLLSVYVPALATNTTVKIQGTFDGGTTWKDIKDTTGAIVPTWASGAGDFIMDGDPLARCAGIPELRFVLGAAQAADVTFKVTTGVL